MQRKRNIKKIIVKILTITGIFIAVMLIAFFALRNVLLEKAITRVSDKMATEYNSIFTVKKAAFKGFSGVEMEGISLVPKNADTLLRVNRISTTINFARLLTGDVQLGTLQIENGFIQLIKNKNGKNFDVFLKKDDKDNNEEEDNDSPDYADRAYSILNRALNLVPTDMELKNLTLRLDDMGRKVNIQLNQLTLKEKRLESSIAVSSKTVAQQWKVSGFADPRNKQADLKFFSSDTAGIALPYLDERYGLKAGFDSIRLNVDNIDMDGGELHVDGFASIKNFVVNHSKIAR